MFWLSGDRWVGKRADHPSRTHSKTRCGKERIERGRRKRGYDWGCAGDSEAMNVSSGKGVGAGELVRLVD